MATQFFYTLSLICMLIGLIFVIMYLLCVDEYYRVSVLRWTGITDITGGKIFMLLTLCNGEMLIMILFCRSIRHNRTYNFWGIGWRTWFHAWLGAQLLVLVFRISIRWSRFPLHRRSTLYRWGQNYASQRNRKGKTVSYGAKSLGYIMAIST